MFGFSASSLVAVACELNTELTAGRLSIAIFCTVTALAAALSGYSTVFFTLEVYYLKRLSDEAGPHRILMIESFMTFTGKWRRFARIATNSALAADLIAVSILLWDFLPRPFAYAVTSILGCGAVLVAYTMRTMKKLASSSLDKADDEAHAQAINQAVNGKPVRMSINKMSAMPEASTNLSDGSRPRRCRRDSDYAVPRPRRRSTTTAVSEEGGS